MGAGVLVAKRRATPTFYGLLGAFLQVHEDKGIERGGVWGRRECQCFSATGILGRLNGAEESQAPARPTWEVLHCCAAQNDYGGALRMTIVLGYLRFKG